MIFLIVLGAVIAAATLGALAVFAWGKVLLGRDEARARSIRAAIEINRMIIEARSKMIDAALGGIRSEPSGK